MDWQSDSTIDVEKASDSRDASLELQDLDTSHYQTTLRATAFLDGLRGLAAFLVYMAHQVPWWYGVGGVLESGFGYHGEAFYFGQLPFVRLLFTGGNAGVAVFFVLSGYVLSISPLRLLRSKQRRACYRNLASGLIRRPIRLYLPPLGVSLAFALVMHLPFGLAPSLAWPTAQASLPAELRNWALEAAKMMDPFRKHGVFEPWFPYDPPAWTMPVELKGSALVFALVAAFGGASPRYAMYLFAITGVFLLAIYEWAMACFLGGVLLASNDLEHLDHAVLGRASARLQSLFHHAMFFVAWYLLGQPAGPRDPEFSSGTWGWAWLTELIPSAYYRNEYWRFYNAIGAFMLVYSVLRIKWLQSFLTTRVILYLGRIAFSLYLIHIPVAWTIGDRIHRILGVIRQDFKTVFDNWLSVPDYGPTGLSTGFLISQSLIIPINLILANVGTRFLDRPSVTGGKRLASWLGLSKKGSHG